MKTIKLKSIVFSMLTVVFCAAGAAAQEADTSATDSDAGEIRSTVSDQTEAGTATANGSVAEKLEALQAKVEAQEEQIKTLSKQQQIAKEDRDEIGMQVMEANAAAAEEKFTISGFMDLSHTASFAKYDDAITYYYQPRYNSFYQTGVNLYFKSQMTETLSALVETRFSYSPNGNITNKSQVTRVDGVETARTGDPDPNKGFERTDTYAKYQFEGGTRLGGVNIERAHLDWKPRDWFGIRAGRYLTPFGIWNEDHGAPVVLTVALPFLISWDVVPTAQTGLMVFGSIFPTDLLKLEYAVTFSNGRGPTENFFDTDHNKAIGLRTKIQLAGDDWLISVGGYGYYGKYTDLETEMVTEYRIDDTGAQVLDEVNYDLPMRSRDVITDKHKEYIGTVDLKLNWKGLTLFGEAGARKSEYLVRPETVYYGTTIWTADFITNAAYGMLAYQLPLEKVFETLTITPFVGVDYLDLSDANDTSKFGIYRFGINIKPSPYVTLKANAYRVDSLGEDVDESTWFVKSQIAVSF